MEITDREAEMLVEAVGEYLDSREPYDELEELLCKLKGEPIPKVEIKFGVGHIESYGNYVFIGNGGDSDHYTEREWAAIRKGFNFAGLPELPQGMEGCFNLDDMYNMDIVRERLREAPNFIHDPQLEQDF